jgi:hypothetical protein
VKQRRNGCSRMLTATLLAAVLVMTILPTSGAWAVTTTPITGPTVTLPAVTTGTVTITAPTTVTLPGTVTVVPTVTVTVPSTVTVTLPGTTITATDATTPGAGLLPAPDGFAPANQGLIVPNMMVQVWPEYDSTDVLVMMDFTLDPTAKLPLTFNFYAPTGARISGIAEIDDNGTFVYGKTPVLTAGTGFDKVAFQVQTHRHLRVEYYYDPGLGQADLRSFPVVFQNPVDAAQVTMSVQQPLRSTGFSVTPALGAPIVDAQGATAVQGSFLDVKEGQRVSLVVAYTKTDAKPSVETSSTTAGTSGTVTGSTNSGAKWLIWLGVIVVVAVAGILVWTMLSPRRPQKPGARGSGQGAKPVSGVDERTKVKPGRQPAGDGKDRRDAAGGKRGPVRFCTECGSKMPDDVRFCPQCGHKREA